MANFLITSPQQITDFIDGMEVEDAARRAPALPIQAANLREETLRDLNFLKAVVSPKCEPDALPVLEQYFDRLTQRVEALAEIPAQASDVLTHAAVLVMKLMTQRNHKTAELAALIEALEAGNEEHPALANFAARLDERRSDYTHLEQAFGDVAAGAMADLFLGRGGVETEALEELIGALVGMWQNQTGRRVQIAEWVPEEQQST